ncbi:hypothetical protein NP493_762g00017 [Ridgeia piscesae]|uniref:SOCS box domain-containing protein n=1 Tax=Ridgeia piscesae TaxID=27915 RepID=A0AAD9KPA4_RIDPI|nr:hypothetical protein NP493_762g00017 [Ridgeia piscesae]
MDQCNLFNAVNNNDAFYLQEVLIDYPDIDVNQALIASLTALHIAAEKGYSSCVTMLIAAGADVDKVDEHGCTALMSAIAGGQALVVVKLLQAGCDFRRANHRNTTALHYASRLGSAGLLQLLLMSGARPDIWNNDGNSPLSIAITNLSAETVQTLLLGCTHVDPNVLAPTDSCPYPLLFALENAQYLLALTMLMSGYRGVMEARTFFSKRESLESSVSDDTDLERLTFIKQSVFKPLSLQHSCRLVLRRSLGTNIWDKVEKLKLPEPLHNFVCFTELWTPLKLFTDIDLYSYFNANSDG